MVCGKGVRVPLGIGSRFRPPVSIAHRGAAAEGASRGENRPFGPLRAHERPADADLDVCYRKHKVADRMKVPLSILRGGVQ